MDYKYVGDGRYWLAGICPDFVDSNGQKIAVEVGSKTHKNWARGSYLEYMKERIDLFKQAGWEVKFYWLEDFVNPNIFYKRKMGIE